MSMGFPVLRIGIAAVTIAGAFPILFRDLFRSSHRRWIRGTVELINASSRVVVVRCGNPSQTRSFLWSQGTIFSNIDGTITAEEVKADEMVRVTFTTRRGQDTASQIEIEPVYDGQVQLTAKSPSARSQRPTSQG